MKQESIVVGGGCFWCVEALFQKAPGILSVESGYAGGKTLNPTYEQICTGTTGHAEVVRITFNSTLIPLSRIIDLFWEAHDPTTLNRQGADVGTQYRSIILYSNEAQKTVVKTSKKNAASRFKDPIVTEISPLKEFYLAETYHQDYYKNNPEQGYCRIVIKPKLDKFKP